MMMHHQDNPHQQLKLICFFNNNNILVQIKGIRDWISISSILILFLCNSGIAFSTNFRVEPYETTVISVIGLIISIFPGT